MKNKVALPITVNPNITSYAYYALPQCIIQAPSRVGDIVAKVTIKDTVSDEWKEIGHWQRTQNTWSVIDDSRFGTDCNACLYHQAFEEDYIQIAIDLQRYSGPWGAVNLFLSNNEEDLLLGDNEYLCRFGSFVYDGVHWYVEGKEQKLHMTPYQTSSLELVLNRKGNLVEVYAGNRELQLLGRQELHGLADEPLYIGIQVRHEDNTFYSWFFSNFISLSCDANCIHRRLDYTALSKHWDFDLPNYFLDMNYYSMDEMLELGGMKFIKKCLEKNKYLELKVDQYYLSGREEYGSQHHLHQNLVYGYDDGNKTFMLIGYNNGGKLNKYRIGYKDMKKSLKRPCLDRVKVICYEQDGHGYPFEKEYVKKMLKGYLQSENASVDTEFLLPQDHRKYGLDIYDELMTEQGMQVFLSDRRVSYVLWEHKYYMKERIDYLTQKEIFNNEGRDLLLPEAEQLVDISFNLRNLVQKYQMRPEKTNVKLIQQGLLEMKEKEKSLLVKMMECWRG